MTRTIAMTLLSVILYYAACSSCCAEQKMPRDEGGAAPEFDFAPVRDEVTARLWESAIDQSKIGNYAAQEDLLRQALARLETTKNEPGPHADLMESLALSLWGQRRTAEAASTARKALEEYEHIYGPDDRRVASGLSLLGNVLRAERRLPEAEAALRRALRIRDRPMDQRVLAECVFAQQRFADTVPLMRRVLDRDKRALGLDHNYVVFEEELLGIALYKLDREQEAKPHLIAAVQRATHPGDQAIYGRAALNLANIYEHQGEMAEAETLYRRSVAILKDIPEARSLMVEASTALASVLLDFRDEPADQTRSDESVELMRMAYALVRAEPDDGLGAPLVRAETARNLSATLVRATRLHPNDEKDAAKLIEAEMLAREALRIDESHDETHFAAKDMFIIGDIMREKGSYLEAEPWLHRSLALTASEKRNDDRAIAIRSLAVVLINTGQYSKAESFLRGERARIAPTNLAQKVTVSSMLAKTLEAQRRSGEAVPFLTEAREYCAAGRHDRFVVDACERMRRDRVILPN